MRFNTGISSALTSFFGNLALVFAIYYLLSETSAFEMVVAVFAAGLVSGVTHGWIFGREHTKVIGICAFLAVLVIWSPIVFATYGLGLLGLPFLLAYSLVVVLGVWFGADGAEWGKPNTESSQV